MTEAWATIAAALIAAFLGSWFGSLASSAQFRRERAFDRQVNWYERVIRALHDMAQKIEIAITFQAEGGGDLPALWSAVQQAHLVIDTLAQEAPLYGSSTAARAAEKIAGVVQDVADKTEAFEPQVIPDAAKNEALERIGELPERLRKAARPLAKEARRHLGIR